MSDPLTVIAKVAWSGIAAQSQRMRIVSENLANAETTSDISGGDPYRRKTISFGNALDDAAGAELVSMRGISRDDSPFRTEYRPGHPAADDSGFVKLPNVNVLIEMADMREAVRSYTANTQMVRQAREMVSATIDLLRS